MAVLVLPYLHEVRMYSPASVPFMISDHRDRWKAGQLKASKILHGHKMWTIPPKAARLLDARVSTWTGVTLRKQTPAALLEI